MQKEKNKCANYFKKIFTKKERKKTKEVILWFLGARCTGGGEIRE